MSTTRNNWTMTRNHETGQYLLENSDSLKNKTISVNCGTKYMTGSIRININTTNCTIGEQTGTQPSTTDYPLIKTLTPTTQAQYLPIDKGYMDNSQIKIEAFITTPAVWEVKPGYILAADRSIYTINQSPNNRYIDMSAGYIDSCYINIMGVGTSEWGTSASGTLQTTVTPSTSAQYVNITAGYTDAKYITINAMPNASWGTSESGTLQKTIYRSTSDQFVNVTAGYTDARYIKINAVADASWSTSASGTLQKTFTPSLSLQYSNVTAGYTSAKYVKCAKINGFSRGSRTNGTSSTSTYSLALSKNEVAIVLSDSCTLYYSNSTSVGSSSSVSVAGGAVVYWDGSNWRVCDYDDSPNTTILGSLDTIYLRTNSGKYLRKMTMQFAT